MKKIILSLLILFMFLNLSFAQGQETKFFGIKQSPLLHGTTTMLMAISINQWSVRFTSLEDDYGIFSIGIPIVALMFNEYADYRWENRKDFYKDFGAGILGAISGKLLCYTF